jgi:EmrB/QacA subfamily drug resistance transporter
VLAVLLLAGLSFAVSQTMVAPALPAIQTQLGASASATAWVMTGFLLAASVATPIMGKLGDVFGKGRVLASLLAAFAAGAVVCALAGSIEVLIAGRVIQGTAAGVFPLAFGIIRDTFPREKVALGIGLISAMFGIGGGFALPLAGVIVDNADLAWLFWPGAAMAGVTALAAMRVIPPSPTAGRARIDWAGAAILSVGLASILVAISRANDWGWGSPRTIGLLGLGLIVLAAFVPFEMRRPDPLVHIEVLRRRGVLFTNITALLVGFAMFASFLLVPMFAQTPARAAGYGFGMSVTGAGLLMVPSSIVMLFAGPLAGAMAGRLGSRLPLVIGALASGAAFILLAVAHDDEIDFIVAGALLGLGIGFSFSSMANLIVEAVDQREVGIATGINTIMRTIGGALGSQVAIAVLTAHTIRGTAIPAESGYTEAFVLSACFSVIAAAAALSIPAARRRAARRPEVEPARA